MASQAQMPCLSNDEYLANELATDERHEYVAGRVFAMGGSSDRHNRIALNLASALLNLTRGGPCQVYMSDMKVRVEAADAYYYPDVVVTCDPDDTAPYYKDRPSLIVEVLSPTTETIDRREKLLAYQKLDSLREYALIASDRRRIQVYRRYGGQWLLVMYEDDDSVMLESVHYNFELDVLYEGVPELSSGKRA